MAPHPLLGLQIAAGNAAVVGMLQRAPEVQRQTVTNDNEFRAAVGRKEWDPAIGYLATLSPTAIDALVKPLGLEVCESLLERLRKDQHTVRGGLLECGFRLAKGLNEWVKAARFVSILDDPGIDANVSHLPVGELRRLAKGARNGPGGGDERLLRVIRKALAAQPGEMFGKVRTNPQPTNGARGRGCDKDRLFFFKMDITFVPDADIVDATKIGFVQTVSMLRTNTRDVVDNRGDIKGRLNEKKQGIDRNDKSSFGWFGQENDGSYPRQKDPRLKSGTKPGSVIGGAVEPAEMSDTPDGNTPDSTYTFETSVIAQSGPDEGLVYAVVNWSFSVDEELKITTGPINVVDKPSADFGDAVTAWNKQAGPDPRPGDQQRLPVFRSIETATTPPPPPRLTRPPVVAPMPAPPAVHTAPTPPMSIPGAAPLPVQRDPKNDEPLKKIQWLPMKDLLPALAALPPNVRNDRDAGMGVGGPRLTAAMTAVEARSKGTPWLEFVGSHSSELSSLYVDQIADILGFLGAPKDARFYGADQFEGDFKGRFDGVVDPGTGIIRLVVRVRFKFGDALQFGASPPGTPAWEKETKEGKERFGPEFKRVVESAWSGKGTVKPSCPIGSIKQFRTEVQVEVVEKGEHIVFDVLRGQGRAYVKKGGRTGALGVHANEPGAAEKRTVMDDTGKRPVDVTNVQTPSPHEFGHAIGIPEVRDTGADNDANYGKTVTERQDIMGAGDKIQVIQRDGKVVHDDLAPFEQVGQRWGKDLFGALAPKCNTWTGSAGSP